MAKVPEWRNRIVRYAEVDPAVLLANPNNFRVHPKHQQQALSGLISEVGYLDPVLVQDGTDVVIDGHLRVELAVRDGVKSIPVQYVDLNDAEANLALASFDPISALATADADKLRDLLDEVSTGDAAIMQMLSDLAEREGVVDFGGGTDLLTDPDDVPEPPDDPITKLGDLWLLGRHRLLCGDSTKAEDVARLMDGERAEMVFTDPPYALFGNSTGVAGVADDRMVEPFFRDIANAISQALTSGGHFYVCCDWHSWAVVERSFARALSVKNMIVWDKGHAALGHFYRSQHELLCSGINKSQSAASTFHKVSNDRRVTDGNVWTIKRENDGTHNAQKPIELMTRAIENSSEGNDLVLDLFGGSGSTLIACEQTNRRCAMMELDPAYCDVIVRRWENATGQTATHATEAMAAD